MSRFARMAGAVIGAAPPIPRRTRLQVCGVQCGSMNSCPDIVTDEYGALPFWDPCLGSLRSTRDRQVAIASKLALGDTHVIIGFDSNVGPIYTGGNTIYARIPGQGYALPEQRQAFYALLAETLPFFAPVIMLGGDGPENSAVAFQDLPILCNLLGQSPWGDLRDQVLVVPGWDGVFYGWDADRIVDFSRWFRKVNPTGHLGLEHNSGHIPLGEGGEDFQPGGRMTLFDVILSEFDFANDTPANDTVWQIADRLLGPSYRRPPDQPANDDPSPPWYLATPTARGPIIPVAFEWEGTYWRVRGRSTMAEEATRRAYMRALGYTFVC